MKIWVRKRYFSIGCVFYKLLSRKDLFQGETQTEILSANRRCQFNIQNLSLIHIPQTAQNLLSEMLHEDPKLRIKATSALQHSFSRKFQTQYWKSKSQFNSCKRQFSYLKIELQKQHSDDEILVDYFNNELPPINEIPVFKISKMDKHQLKIKTIKILNPPILIFKRNISKSPD